MVNRTYINNKLIYGFNEEKELLSKIKKFKGLLIAVGLEKILNEDKKFQKIINDNIAYPDGIGAVYALKRKGIKSAKIPGSKLWLKVVDQNYENKTFFLLGAKKNVIENVVKKLEREYKGIKIVGFNDGYFNNEKKIINIISSLKPDIVFVALGSPKQEFFMDKSNSIHKALYMGLGGSFDLYTGIVRDVPKFWKKYFKWEGLFRVLFDFTNLKRWKRQFILFKFIKAIILKKI